MVEMSIDNLLLDLLKIRIINIRTITIGITIIRTIIITIITIIIILRTTITINKETSKIGTKIMEIITTIIIKITITITIIRIIRNFQKDLIQNITLLLNTAVSLFPLPFSISYLPPESSETLSNKILIDISYEEPTNHNKTQAVAKKFHVDPNLVGFNEEEEGKDEEDDISLGHLLQSFTTENEKETDSKGEKKKGSKQKFNLQAVGVELHNIWENKLTVMKMKIELPCSECTFLTYQILSKKDAKDPWIFKAKRCRFCLESSKNIIQTKYNGN